MKHWVQISVYLHRTGEQVVVHRKGFTGSCNLIYIEQDLQVPVHLLYIEQDLQVPVHLLYIEPDLQVPVHLIYIEQFFWTNENFEKERIFSCRSEKDERWRNDGRTKWIVQIKEKIIVFLNTNDKTTI